MQHDATPLLCTLHYSIVASGIAVGYIAAGNGIYTRARSRDSLRENFARSEYARWLAIIEFVNGSLSIIANVIGGSRIYSDRLLYTQSPAMTSVCTM